MERYVLRGVSGGVRYSGYIALFMNVVLFFVTRSCIFLVLLVLSCMDKNSTLVSDGPCNFETLYDNIREGG